MLALGRGRWVVSQKPKFIPLYVNEEEVQISRHRYDASAVTSRQL